MVDNCVHINNIKQAYLQLEASLAQELYSLGRAANEVLILGVSKHASIEEIDAAFDAGCSAFGENRPDSLVEKYQARPQYIWHYIGNIQSRQIPKIVACSSLIHSLYKLDHLYKIDKAAADLGKIQDCLIQVDISGEETKSGCKPQDVKTMLLEAQSLKHVRMRGLMTMAPKFPEERIVSTFKGLEELRSELLRTYPPAAEQKSSLSVSLEELSSGMSQDWRCAIRYGSTIIRIGRSLFNPEQFRPTQG